MLIVTGTFHLDPADRERFLASVGDMMRRSRAEDGCHEYCMAPDPLEPGRVILSERWESRVHLDAHLAAMIPPSDPVPTISREIVVHEIASSTPLG